MSGRATNETFAIRVAPHRAPDVYRVIELRSPQKLRDLHAAIAEQFELGEPAAWRFFMSNRPFAREGEYTHDGKGRQAVLGKLELKTGSKFLHMVADSIENWYRCEVTAVGKVEAGAAYPRVLEAQGEAPDPYPDFEMLFGAADEGDFFGGGSGDDGDEDEGDEEGDEEEANEPGPSEPSPAANEAPSEEPPDAATLALIDEAARSAAEYDAHFEREDAAEAPRPRELVVRDLGVARRIAERFRDRPDQLEALLAERDEGVFEWLEMLPFDLEDHGMSTEAIALCEALRPVLDPADLDASRASLLQRAGRNDEALAQGEAALDEFPDSIDVRVRVAEVMHRLGRNERAEELCMGVLTADLEGEDAVNYQSAIETLSEVLRATGREAEIARWENSEQAKVAEAYAQGDAGDFLSALETLLGPGEAPPPPEDKPASSAPVRKAPPKPGRNDPCPCGSGRKYRDCHGA